MVHAARWKCRTQNSPKNRHLGTTIPQLCRAVFSQLRHISTVGKYLLSSNIFSTCPYTDSLLCLLYVACMVFGWPLIKQFAVCYPTVVCLSVLLVTLVYCGQTVGCVKMKLGMEVELGPGHIVSDGDPFHPFASFPQKGGGRAAPTFRPMFVVAKWSPISATAEHLLSYGM